MRDMLTLRQLETAKDFHAVGIEMDNALAMDEGRTVFEAFARDDVNVWVLRMGDAALLAMSVRVRDNGRYINHVVGPQNAPPDDRDLALLEKMCDILGVSLEYDPSTVM
jgi:hypothetical protein